MDLGGGRWSVRVFIGRDPKTGKQLRKAGTFKADGIRRARPIAAELRRTLREEWEEERRGVGTLAEATEQWWDLWSARPKSPATRQGYRSNIDNHILKSPLAKKKVTELRVDDFDRWYGDLTRKVSAATVHRIHAIVKQVLDQRMRAGELAANPAAMAHKPPARKVKRPYTTPEQVVDILQAAAQRHPVRARALAFAALTGLRRGEVVGMRWSSIDPVRGVMLVERNTVAVQRRFVNGPASRKRVTAADREMVRHHKDPKSHQAAILELGDRAAGIVAQQMEWQRSEAMFRQEDMAADPVLWQVRPPFAETLWPDVLSHWMTDAREVAGYPAVRLHDLRHYQASQFLVAGGTVEDARVRLRHEALTTTMAYLEADRTQQRALVDRLPLLEWTEPLLPVRAEVPARLDKRRTRDAAYRLPAGDPRHGKRAGYAKGCRCDDCVEANRVNAREHFRRQRADR